MARFRRRFGWWLMGLPLATDLRTNGIRHDWRWRRYSFGARLANRQAHTYRMVNYASRSKIRRPFDQDQ